MCPDAQDFYYISKTKKPIKTCVLFFLYKFKMTQCLWTHIKKDKLHLKTDWNSWSQMKHVFVLRDSTCCGVTSLHRGWSLIYTRQMDCTSGWALVFILVSTFGIQNVFFFFKLHSTPLQHLYFPYHTQHVDTWIFLIMLVKDGLCRLKTIKAWLSIY